MNLTLLVKAWNGGQLKQIGELLQNQFEELAVEVKVLGNPVNRWVQVSVSGEDEAVAAAYIRKEIGTCPVSLEAVENGSVLRGYVSKIDGDKQLIVDIGVFEPKGVQATVPLACLRSQLAGGKEVELKEIVEAYAVAEGLPISVKIVSRGDPFLLAELSPQQVDKLHSWQQSLLDRLIVLRASKDLVAATLERTRLDRDVIDVEALGLFEYALTCKLGTEARGLIPRVGRYMRNAVFVVFNSKKSVDFLSEQALTL
jgi:hypothetical protein